MPNPTSGVAGAINCNPKLIADILDNYSTVTAVSPAEGSDPLINVKTMRPQLALVCDETGAQANAIVLIGDLFTTTD